jgi:hypothetical protein
MMDCKQFREVLDCYVDGELSAAAMSAADAHRRECASCARVAADVEALRRHVRRVVTAHLPPPGLEGRVRHAIRSPWMPPGLPPAWLASRTAVAATLVLALAAWVGLSPSSRVQEGLVVALDRAVLSLAAAEPTVFEATVLCRDCELKKRYGEEPACDRIGHHGALATADGHLWNIVEQPSSVDLIHDDALLGRKVRVRGRLFREAGSIAVESYQIL